MFHRLDHRAGHYLLLLALWAVLCLVHLGTPSLWDIDEGNNATCASEMRASGNLVIPTFNGQLREDKPALLYWLQIAGAELFGVNEWAARFPSALAALLAALAVYELGRQMFDVRTGLLAAVVMLTSICVLGAAHFANPDALLLAFTTLSLALFWHDYRTGGRGWLVGSAVAAGVAVLAKGPVGVLLPGAVVVLFLLWQRHLRRLCDLRLPGAILAFLLVAVPWYVWVALETKGAWLRGFWFNHHVKRTFTSMENHSGPPYYYVLVLLAGLAPWSIFLWPTIRHTFDRFRASRKADPSSHEQAALRFLTVWFAVYFIPFSLVRTKLPNYILPAYPAAALLTAHLLERWRRGEAIVPAWQVRFSLASMALTGVAVAAGLLLAGGAVEVPRLHDRTFPGMTAWAGIGAVLVAGAAVAWRQFERGARGGLILTVVASAVLFAGPLAGWAVQEVEVRKAARPLARALPADQQERDVHVGAYGYFQPSLVFYCGREVQRCNDENQALRLLATPVPSYLFVPEGVWADLAARTRVTGRVLARHADVYGGKTILLVTNEPAVAEKGLAGASSLQE
jgi:4-amino-4-deoxy-L-arabinose transferase-like glycosyltransferase